MQDGDYTAGEVLFLLSLTREDAIKLDAYPQSPAAAFTPDGLKAGASSSAEQDPVMVIARWHDVQAARKRVQLAARDRLVMHARILTFTEREIAELLDTSHTTVRRRFRAKLDEILLELGGEAIAPEAPSSPSACLRCGARPRARIAERRRRVKGGWRIVSEEKQSALCRECTPPEQREQLVPPRRAGDE